MQRTGRGRQCPLWVKSRHLAAQPACPLYSRKRTCAVQLGCPLWAKSGHELCHSNTSRDRGETQNGSLTTVVAGGTALGRPSSARKRTRRNFTSRLRPGRETQSCSSSRRRPVAGHIFEPVEIEVLDRARDGDPVEDL